MNEEKIIHKGSYYTLTNRRLIIGDQTNSIFLSDIKEVELISHDVIQLTLYDNKKIKLGYGTLTAGSVINEALTYFFAPPYTIGFAQEERSAITSYYASLITMAVFLFGDPETYVELKPRQVWCSQCAKYVEIPGTSVDVWKIECPICGRKGMISKRP